MSEQLTFETKSADTNFQNDDNPLLSTNPSNKPGSQSFISASAGSRHDEHEIMLSSTIQESNVKQSWHGCIKSPTITKKTRTSTSTSKSKAPSIAQLHYQSLHPAEYTFSTSRPEHTSSTFSKISQGPDPNFLVGSLQFSLSQLKGPIAVIVDYLKFSYSPEVRQFIALRQDQLIKANDTKSIKQCAEEINQLLDCLLTRAGADLNGSYMPYVDLYAECGYDNKTKKTIAGQSQNEDEYEDEPENIFSEKFLDGKKTLKGEKVTKLLRRYHEKMSKKKSLELSTDVEVVSESASHSSNMNARKDCKHKSPTGLGITDASNPGIFEKARGKSFNNSKNKYNYQYGMPIPPYSSLFSLKESGEYSPIIPELPNKQEIINLNTPKTSLIGQEIPPLSDLHDLLGEKMQLASKLVTAKLDAWNYNAQAGRNRNTKRQMKRKEAYMN